MSEHRTTDDVIAGLVGELRPVRRAWHPGRWLGTWMLGTVAVVALGLLVHGRPDLGGRLHELPFLLELALCLALTLRLGQAALDAATPDRRDERIERIGPAIALVVVTGLALLHPPNLTAFVAAGLEKWHCATLTMWMAAIPGLVLLAALRHGAPLAPRGAALLAGAATAVLTYGAMRAACPSEECLHLLVWHALPAALVVVACGLAGPAWLGRWHAE